MCQQRVNPDLPTDIEAPTPSKRSSEAKETSLEVRSLAQHITNAKQALMTSEAWIGDYDYKALCMPRIPFLKRTNRSIFFGLNDRIPILVALVMGFQHSLAMASGVISVPRILAGSGVLNFPPSQASYVISTSLTVCGFMTLIQIIRFRLARGYYIGTGLVSMSGTSFTFLPVVEFIVARMREEGKCGDLDAFESCQRSVYGKWLGTAAVASLIEIGVSFLPPAVLTSLFPPIVSGCTVFLIGASLVGVGVKYWAGGVGPCYNYSKIKLLGGTPSDSLAFFANCPSLFGPRMQFPWGDSHWIGLGFFVFAIIILIGIFGSPFLRNIQVMIGLIAGIILAAVTGYMDKEFMDSSPTITFPFVETFPLSVYWPAVIPTMIGYLVSAVDTVGDISATAELSRVATEGPEFESRIQGGLLADGVNSLLATLLTASPTATFSENNGVIALTRTANKYAGIAAACFLILYGTFGKIGGVLGATPDAVIGGMTTFLFATVAVSGISMLSAVQWNVRNRLIVAISLGLGLGVSIEPKAFSSFIPEAKGEFMNGLRLALVFILETGYTLGALTAIFLNLVLPTEDEEYSPEEFKKLNKNEDVSMEDRKTGSISTA